MNRSDVATSPQVLRRMNSAAVLRFALSTEVFRALDVMEATGLTRATALGLCDELVGQGWIEEVDDARSAGEHRKGRPARRYRLRERAGLLVAVDAGVHRLTAVVADLKGAVLGRGEAAFEDERAPRRVDTVRAAVDHALAEAGGTAEEVFLSVVGVPAPVDAEGRSPDGHGFWRLVNPGFERAFAQCGRLVVENDANLAAMAELARAEGPGSSSFAALLSGERVGAGLVLDGRLIRGPHGGAGELRLLEHVEGVGSADGFGLLARTWAAEARGSGAFGPGSALSRGPVTAERVLAAAAEGDAGARAVVDRLGDRLARIAEVLASLLDVEKVILSGAFAAAATPVIERAETTLASRAQPPRPRLLASGLGVDAVVVGALESALSLLREQPLGFTPAR